MSTTTTAPRRRGRGRVAGSPAPERVTRMVGPIDCRFVADRALPDDKRPANVDPVPTVRSIAAVAWRLLRVADGVPIDAPREQMRAALLDPRRTRDAAAAAVKVQHLRRADGKPLTKSEAAPLVTLVRRQLVADLRESFAQQDAADRRAARELARELRDAQRAFEKAVARFAAKPSDMKRVEQLDQAVRSLRAADARAQ